MNISKDLFIIILPPMVLNYKKESLSANNFAIIIPIPFLSSNCGKYLKFQKIKKKVTLINT